MVSVLFLLFASSWFNLANMSPCSLVQPNLKVPGVLKAFVSALA